MFKQIVVISLLILFSENIFAQTTISEPSQSTTVQYRLFRTNNIWTFIELDTVTGKMWQIQFDIKGSNRGSVVLNPNDLANRKRKVLGRFTLYPTSNMYTFILVDQIDGNTWQVQWSVENENRLILPISE